LATARDDLADVAFTLQIGRREFQNRRAVVCVDPEDARAALESPTDRRVLTGSTHHRRKPVVFMFSGQGSQHVDMARGIYESEPEFRAHVDRCAEILQPTLGYDIREVIYPATSDRGHATDTLRQTATTQPALFVIEYALAMLWQSWGVQPKAMVGHSIGEYVAACLAGVFTLEDALSLVAARGRLMQSLPAGAMLSVPLTEREIGPLLDARTCVAVINSEGMCVVSGEHDAVDALEATLSARGVQARRVQTSHAFHSHMMDPILDAFRDEVTKAQPQEPRSPIVSNVTGTWLTPEQAIDPDYWVQHLRQTVRFRDCLTTLLEEPDRVLLEVGPGRTLASLTRMHTAKTGDTDVLSSTRHPEESRPDAEFLLESIGRLWIAGASIDWQRLHVHRRGARVPVPTYPFERHRYWLEPGRPAGFVAPSPSTDPRSTADLPRIDPRDEPSPSQLVDGDANGDSIERAIAAIWEDLLGVSGVGRDEDFFDLGGTSLVAARMLALIARRYGRRLPLSILIDAPTVATLATVVRDAEAETPSLVDIQRGDGTKPPLFLVHAEGGHVLTYRHLAMRIGKDWTVVGIQSRGLDGESEPSGSVEEMAERYVSEIREIQPHGPYYLGGYCLGGTIAYEMAKQFEHGGERVAWLGMIQARHTSYWASLEGASGVRRLAWGLADRAAFESESVSSLNGRAKVRYLSEKTLRKAMRTWARVPIDRQRGGLVADLAAANALYCAHTDAYWAYEAPPYDGRVALFRSSNQPRGIAPDPTLGWKDVLRGEVELYEIDSFHRNIFDEERSEKVGRVVRESIDAALSREEDANAAGQPRIV
jgi:malonyl CoA-acyl carrier protein transacylase